MMYECPICKKKVNNEDELLKCVTKCSAAVKETRAKAIENEKNKDKEVLRNAYLDIVRKIKIFKDKYNINVELKINSQNNESSLSFGGTKDTINKTNKTNSNPNYEKYKADYEKFVEEFANELANILDK